MGANFETMTLDGKLDRKAVEAAFAGAQDDDRYENGHSYSGGFGMATGLIFTSHSFADADAAYSFLDENCRKWAEAQAVQFVDKDGVARWMIGACCAS